MPSSDRISEATSQACSTAEGGSAWRFSSTCRWRVGSGTTSTRNHGSSLLSLRTFCRQAAQKRRSPVSIRKRNCPSGMVFQEPVMGLICPCSSKEEPIISRRSTSARTAGSWSASASHSAAAS